MDRAALEVLKNDKMQHDKIARYFYQIFGLFSDKDYGKFVFIRSSVATKKGNSVGTTDIAHSFKPVFAAKIFEEENNIKQNVNSNKTNCNKKFFNFIIKNFIINSVPSI